MPQSIENSDLFSRILIESDETIAAEIRKLEPSVLQNLRDKHDLHILHLAVRRGYLQTIDAICSILPDSWIEIEDKWGDNALHLAAAHGQVAVVAKLLEIAPRLAYIKDNRGWNALHIAAFYGQSCCCGKAVGNRA